MSEHYTQNTLEVTAWCGKCQADTQHRVDGGRRGPCLACLEKQLAEIRETGGLSKKQIADRKKKQKEFQNPRLF
jgi:hypothetical protein